MKFNFHKLQFQNWKPERKTIVLKVLQPIGILEESPSIKKFSIGLKVSTEKSDSSSLKIIDSLQNEKTLLRSDKYKQAQFKIKSISLDINIRVIDVTSNLENIKNISPYITEFIDNYSALDWLVNYLEKVLDISCLFFWNLKINEKSKEITIYNGGVPRIIYKYQNDFISKENLDMENQKYLDKGISCRWFFGQKADNKISENWSYKIYGEYCYFIYSNSIAIEARQLFSNNSVGLPLNPEEEGSIIRKTMNR